MVFCRKSLPGKETHRDAGPGDSENTTRLSQSSLILPNRGQGAPARCLVPDARNRETLINRKTLFFSLPFTHHLHFWSGLSPSQNPVGFRSWNCAFVGSKTNQHDLLFTSWVERCQAFPYTSPISFILHRGSKVVVCIFLSFSYSQTVPPVCVCVCGVADT